jgi:hypothetical protein
MKIINLSAIEMAFQQIDKTILFDKNDGVKPPSNLLKKLKDSNFLIYIPNKINKEFFNLNKLVDIFKFDESLNNVCFYNQDWYFKEDFFFNSPKKSKWVLINKSVKDQTRGLNPSNIKNLNLLSSFEYTFIFFTYFLITNKYLWPNDYIWTNDFDSHNDQIYVGRYFDVTKKNKNGFSIHRHLSIKNNYGVLSHE